MHHFLRGVARSGARRRARPGPRTGRSLGTVARGDPGPAEARAGARRGAPRGAPATRGFETVIQEDASFLEIREYVASPAGLPAYLKLAEVGRPRPRRPPAASTRPAPPPGRPLPAAPSPPLPRRRRRTSGGGTTPRGGPTSRRRREPP